MSDESFLPAWSGAFSPETLPSITVGGPLAEISREWAWGNSTGQGVRVAVIDSGIDADHPAVKGAVCGGVVVEYDERTETRVRIENDHPSHDLSGHGTACAGI